MKHLARLSHHCYLHPFLVMLFVFLIQLPTDDIGAANTQIDAKLKRADKFYDRKKYKKAYKKYIELAKVGDKYSQYKIAVMHYEGFGRPKSTTDAFAWAYVAAEENNKDLKQFRDAIWRFVPENQRSGAKVKAKQVIENYGNLAIAINRRNSLSKAVKNCTGSRVGASCEALWSSGVPDGSVQSVLNVAGGPRGDSTANTGGSMSADGGSGAALGALPTSKDTFVYMEIRDSLRLLDRYIEVNSGNVEIHDIEIVDEN